MKELVFAVNDSYEVTYVSPQISVITGKTTSESIGTLCYKEFVGRGSPCPNCPIKGLKGSDECKLFHDLIAHNGDRLFYTSSITSPESGLYLEVLTDVTEMYKENERARHQMKEMRAIQVTTQLQRGQIKGSYDFLNNVINSLGYGLLVADRDYNIVVVNSILKNHASSVSKHKLTRCYHVYNNDRPCNSCPYDNMRITKSPREMGDKSVTVTFEPYMDYIVESVRDTTREIRLINEIRNSQEEVREKQRQMELLNKDLLRMNDDLKVAQNRIDEELHQVGELQKSLLPEHLPMIDGFEFGAFYTPAEQAGGDYYDCIEMSNGYLGLTVADVSGHGTPAAVIMAMARAIMRSYTYDVISSSDALNMMNEILCDNIHTRDFVTMFYTVMDPATSKLNFASAGHNPMLHFDKSEMMVRTLTANGMFLGTFPNVEFEEKSLVLDEDDILFMYTDGLVEAMNAKREQYGLDRVISRLMMYSTSSCDRIINEIMSDVKSFTMNLPFDDDVTILVVKKTKTSYSEDTN
jgi:sigma-B regulation protein RsbU (phosphoserine phosphatase)